MIRFRKFWMAAWVLLVFQGVLSGQTLSSGPQVLTFFSQVDDSDQPYAVYIPPNYDASKQYPLVISLHGAGSNHRLNLRRVFGKSNAGEENDVEATRYFPEWRAVDYVVASPYARGTMGYQGVAEKDVLAVLADVKRRFSIDEDRIYLTGLSMGGGGTLWIGLTRPDIWAAIAPVCPAPPSETENFAPNALHVPAHFFHGAADPVVNPQGVREWVARLQELEGVVEYSEFPGVGHDSWVNAYADGGIFEWFAKHRRDRYPERVRFATDRFEYHGSYWVRVDALTPGTVASIDVRFTGPNRLNAAASNLDAFTLSLAGHPRYQPDKYVELLIEGQIIRTEGTETLSYYRKDDGWVAGAHASAPGSKRKGLEGPMSQVIATRHVYVFGTGGDPDPETLDKRRAEAEKAADWSVYRGPFWGRVMVFPRVVADNDVRPSDLESANLVLFGTRETNSLIARFSDRLPLHLDPEADGYGLVYVFPVENRYVLVSSGLPWWASARPPSPFTGGVAAFGLSRQHDFILFKETSENVIFQGRFDTQWRLNDADAQAVREIGVITVKDSEPAPVGG